MLPFVFHAALFFWNGGTFLSFSSALGVQIQPHPKKEINPCHIEGSNYSKITTQKCRQNVTSSTYERSSRSAPITWITPIYLRGERVYDNIEFRTHVSPPRYHPGGKVMSSPTSVHVIWYGNWSSETDSFTNSFQTSIRNFLDSICYHHSVQISDSFLSAESDKENQSSLESASEENSSIKSSGAPTVADWWKINTEYTDERTFNVTSEITRGAEAVDAYSRGTELADADVVSIVQAALESSNVDSGLPTASKDAVYVVITSADVYVNGQCTELCAYHNFFKYNHGRVVGNRANGGEKTNEDDMEEREEGEEEDDEEGIIIKYVFLGNPSRCIQECSSFEFGTITPNGYPSIDAAVSILGHELIETTNDPEHDTWYNPQGFETADLCAWTFGKAWTAPRSGEVYNMVGVDGTLFYVQQNYRPPNRGCATTTT